MKNSIKGLVIVTIALAIAPLLPAMANTLKAKSLSTPDETVVSASVLPEESTPYPFISSVNIYNEDTGATYSMPIEDYLVSAVLGALSPDAEPELLQAQAVLAYTYILNCRLNAIETRYNGISGCDVSTDEAKYPRLLGTEEASEIYGDSWESYYEKLRAAIESCIGEYAAYDSYPILTPYCFSCGGTTESAFEVIGEEVPYLASVDSPFDAEYSSEAVFTSDELFAKLTTNGNSYTLLGDPEQWLSFSEVCQSGYVKAVTLDSKYTVSGEEFAKMLGLPSQRFTFRYSEEFDRFIFSVSGCGHLMGMSQFGANKMAAAGASHKEILELFYPGITIENSVKK